METGVVEEIDLPFSDEGYYIFEYNIKQILKKQKRIK